MLTIKCAACKQKLFKYHKIGPGHVLRCHKKRIGRLFHARARDDKLICSCGQEVGQDKGTYYSMDKRSFTYSGTKVNK